MRRKPPFDRCERRRVPGRLRAEILLRQQGQCADCGTRLILGFFVFDHRPPLALREQDEDANDPERLAAICWTCDEQKTPRDLKEIARTKRLAEKHQDYLERQRAKVPGRRLPSRRQWAELQEALGHGTAVDLAGPERSSDEENLGSSSQGLRSTHSCASARFSATRVPASPRELNTAMFEKAASDPVTRLTQLT